MGIAMGASEFSKIIVSADEYAETFGVSKTTAYKQIKDAAESMFLRYLTMLSHDGRTKYKVRWLQDLGSNKLDGFIELNFSEKVRPFLLDLQSEFTQYKLSQACALRSIHSWRMLELLEKNKNYTKDAMGFVSFEVSLDALHHMFEATPTYISNFSLFRQNVINVGTTELIKKDNWLITWEAIKSGRKTKAIRFKYKKNNQLGLFFDN